MDRVHNITLYRVYVDSHSLGQLALASKRTASYIIMEDIQMYMPVYLMRPKRFIA